MFITKEIKVIFIESNDFNSFNCHSCHFLATYSSYQLVESIRSPNNHYFHCFILKACLNCPKFINTIGSLSFEEFYKSILTKS